MIQSQIKFQIVFINHREKQLCNNCLFAMSEHNELERPPTTSKVAQDGNQGHKEQFKLPKLTLPQSRGRLMSRKQNKAPTFLPNIHDDTESDHNFRNTDTIHASKSDNEIARSQEYSMRDDFAYEVQQKLKMMVQPDQGNQNQQQNQQRFNDENDNISDDSDFQQKILQNKEIIKMHRKKTQLLSDKKMARPLEVLQKINELNKFKPTSHNNKPLSNYEKKMKDYNMSLENKYLQKKKQSLGIIPEKAQQKPVQRAKSKKILSLKDAAVEQAKLNFGYKQFKNPSIGSGSAIAKSQSKDGSRVVNPVGGNKSHKQPSIVPIKPQSGKQPHTKTQQPTSPSKRINRTSALFDNIQSFLENPIAGEKHDKMYKELFKKLKAKSIPQLQEKIKELEDKLGGDQKCQTKSTLAKDDNVNETRQLMLTENLLERTVRDWKRVDVKARGNLHCQESNFQKQLDYINYLQEKNSSSLTKFIDQQKLLVELQIHRRISKSIGKQVSSDTAPTKREQTQLRETNTGEQST